MTQPAYIEGDMARYKLVIGAGLVAMAIVVLHSDTIAQTTREHTTVEDIRRELLQLPYYGVFDFLAFSYEKGTVTLVGYAYRPALKEDAARAVRRVAGVDTVANRIEELPLSPADDDLRWKVYYAIYRDPFLVRYAPGGSLLWGHRHAIHTRSLMPFGSRLFPGMEPAGDYPIHIIVKNGRITLLGVVDNENDKTVAGIRAREVPGSFGVQNELTVERGLSTSTEDR